MGVRNGHYSELAVVFRIDVFRLKVFRIGVASEMAHLGIVIIPKRHSFDRTVLWVGGVSEWTSFGARRIIFSRNNRCTIPNWTENMYHSDLDVRMVGVGGTSPHRDDERTCVYPRGGRKAGGSQEERERVWARQGRGREREKEEWREG